MKVTPARRDALEVLADHHPTPLRVSNATSRAETAEDARVYWSQARTLVKAGLATVHSDNGHERVALTSEGVGAVAVHLDRTLEDAPPASTPAPSTSAESTGEVTVPVGSIVVSGRNPRRDLGDLSELAASIREQGVQVPLIVRPSGDGWELVAGHRRLAAATQVGLTVVPVVTRHLDDAEARTVRLLENLHRRDLDPLEEAVEFRQVLDEGMSQLELASALGVTQPHVSKRLSLLQLPAKVHRMLDRKELTVTEAVELAKLTGDTARLDRALEEGAKTWKGYERAVREELADLRREQQVVKLRGEVDTTGLRYVPDGQTCHYLGSHDKAVDLEQVVRDRDVTADEHENLECHAATVIDTRPGDPEIRLVCTDPDSHPERQLELVEHEEKDAAEVRKDAAAQVVALLDDDAAVRWAAKLAVPVEPPAQAPALCRMLDVPAGDDAHAALNDFAQSSPAAAARTLLAIFARVAVADYGRVYIGTRRHLNRARETRNFLALVGWTPTPDEDEWLAESETRVQDADEKGTS